MKCSKSFEDNKFPSDSDMDGYQQLLRKDSKQLNHSWRIHKQLSLQNVLQPNQEAINKICEQDLNKLFVQNSTVNKQLYVKNVYYHLYMQKITREIKFRVGSTLDEMNELIIDKKTNYLKRIDKLVKQASTSYSESFSNLSQNEFDFELNNLFNKANDELQKQFLKCYNKIYSYPSSCFRFNQQIYDQYLSSKGITQDLTQFKSNNQSYRKSLIMDYIQNCITFMKQLDQQQYRLNSPYYALIKELLQFEVIMLNIMVNTSNYFLMQYLIAIYTDMKHKLVIITTNNNLISIEVIQNQQLFDKMILKSKEMLNQQIIIINEPNYIQKQKQMQFKQLIREQNVYSQNIKQIKDPQQFKQYIEQYMQSEHVKMLKMESYNDILNAQDLNDLELQYFSDSSDEDDLDKYDLNNDKQIVVRDQKYQPNCAILSNNENLIQLSVYPSTNDLNYNLLNKYILSNDNNLKQNLKDQLIFHQINVQKQIIKEQQGIFLKFVGNISLKNKAKRICNQVCKYQLKIAEQKYTLIQFAYVPFTEFHKQPVVNQLNPIKSIQQSLKQTYQYNISTIYQIQQIQYELLNPFAKDFNRLLQFENNMIVMIQQLDNVSDIECLLQFTQQAISKCKMPLITEQQQIDTIQSCKQSLAPQIQQQQQHLVQSWRSQMSQKQTIQDNECIQAIKALIAKYHKAKNNVENFSVECSNYQEVFGLLEEYANISQEFDEIMKQQQQKSDNV
ncbi:Hypothetical_protein [Hexamita inflata]|uniref:Hypothetical_protein n=1 Tax=Hexamita inflata TaxID=28002 RepID=A0AA86R5J3_9EUKA|nr:Hypothetical protein HINF_LOCUS56923 [Hexamita inflata]